ncbi:hypothetical protein GQ43DRAFT_500012, partial [Delitschia confertaspora ATCC 74209]
MAIDLILRWILLIITRLYLSPLTYFLHTQPTPCSRLMWRCSSLSQLPTQLSCQTTFTGARHYSQSG